MTIPERTYHILADALAGPANEPEGMNGVILCPRGLHRRKNVGAQVARQFRRHIHKVAHDSKLRLVCQASESRAAASTAN